MFLSFIVIDDMEQWVSDTFYSYFPSINNETKKRQIHLQNKQLEYQQNYLKTIAEAAPHKKITPRPAKTDIEIIVNNPDYGDNGKVRPGSTRHQLIQDLGHTNLSHMVNNDGIGERNKINAEREVQNRRNYQHALLRQIEEKRHQIEMLKEKEKYEEEALTKRLEQQLKTMRLEEELEKEKLRIEKVRFETEQSKLKRQQLLAKLEKERKVLESRETKSENDKESVLSQDNRVYKYFSNSARKEFSHRRRPSFVDDNEKVLSEKALNIRKEMSEHSEPEEILKKKEKCMECISTSCPFCKIKLKSYDCWCIKCAREVTDFKGVENRSLICDNCEKKYLICKTCDEGVDKCGNCKKRRNICLDCLRNVCFNCGESPHEKRSNKKSLSSERSFQILDMNYPTSEEDFESNTKSYRPPFSINIDKNSKFHPNFKDDEVLVDENLDRLRVEANNKIKNYVKNYGDIMSPRTRTTEKDLYMPLLKEMPRKALTAKGEEILGSKPKELEKWDVPAVQKNYISKTSPKVITQLGAIRKQLQEEIFFDSNP